MKRFSLKLDGPLLERFTEDAALNKRGPQAEFEYLAERALRDIGRESIQAREMREGLAGLAAREEVRA